MIGIQLWSCFHTGYATPLPRALARGALSISYWEILARLNRQGVSFP